MKKFLIYALVFISIGCGPKVAPADRSYPLTLIFVDSSDSMKKPVGDRTAYEVARGQCIDLVRQLSRHSEVRVYRFGRRPEEVAAGKPDEALEVEIIDGLKLMPGFGTDYAAVFQSASGVAAQHAGHTRVYILGDGYSDAGGANPAPEAARLLENDVDVVIAGVGAQQNGIDPRGILRAAFGNSPKATILGPNQAITTSAAGGVR